MTTAAFPNHLPPLPRDRSVPIGCIGAGFIMADCHLPAYRAAGFEVAAIAARRPEAARAVADRHGIATVHDDAATLLDDRSIAVVDIAVPPDVQPDLIRAAAVRPHLRGILAQKPLARSHAEAEAVVRACEASGTTLVVNQNMRHDHAVAACRALLVAGTLGDPVLATIEMRAVPHWMPWQERQGWVTLRIMSIHHLDCLRDWFGDPRRISTVTRADPRTARAFSHRDGICVSILQYDSGLVATCLEDVWAGPAREGAEADSFVRFRVEGTRGMALGTIGWPSWPAHTPSTLDWTTTAGGWHRPRWPEAWFPDAFVGPMAELLRDLEGTAPARATGRDNLMTLALVDAAYRSADEHRAVDPREIIGEDAAGRARPEAS